MPQLNEISAKTATRNRGRTTSRSDLTAVSVLSKLSVIKDGDIFSMLKPSHRPCEMYVIHGTLDCCDLKGFVTLIMAVSPYVQQNVCTVRSVRCFASTNAIIAVFSTTSPDGSTVDDRRRPVLRPPC